MDMTTEFYFAVDGIAKKVKVVSWQEAFDELLKHCKDNGFEIDDKLHKQLVELAKFRRVSL